MADYSKVTTFNTMAAQIIDILEGGDQPNDSRYDERVVARHIRQAASRHIQGQIERPWSNGKQMPDPKFIATFNEVDVEEDAKTGENYATIPCKSYFSLENYTEIQRVAPKKPGEKRYGPAMIPISPHEMDIYRPLAAGYVENQLTYEPDRDRVIFHKKGNKTLLELGITQVQIKVISIDPESIGDDDPIPMSSDLQYMIIADVLQMLGMKDQQIADYLTNANSNVQQQ